MSDRKLKRHPSRGWYYLNFSDKGIANFLPCIYMSRQLLVSAIRLVKCETGSILG